MSGFTEMFYGSSTGLGQIGDAYQPVQHKPLYETGVFAQDTTAGYGMQSMPQNTYNFN